MDDLRAFPEAARRTAGFELRLLQQGEAPTDFRPMRTVGSGVYEIRIREEGQAFRVFYVAKFDSGIYVLHAFEKKTRKTPQKDIDIGRTRYKALVRELEGSKK